MTSPRVVAEFLLPQYGNRRVEQFGVLLLDTKHRVLRIPVLSVGTLDASIVHPREVFREAVAAGAAAIVLFHNHPSGDPEPSIEDTAPDRAADGGRRDDGDQRPGSRDPRRRAVFQLSGEGNALIVGKTLYIDCFSGVAGDMFLGAPASTSGCRSRPCGKHSAAWRSITGRSRASGSCGRACRRRNSRLVEPALQTAAASVDQAAASHSHAARDHIATITPTSPGSITIRTIPASPGIIASPTSSVTSTGRRCRPRSALARSPCSAGWPKRRPRFIRCRSIGSTCTKSAPSTRLSTSSDPSSPWSGSGRIRWWPRRSMSAAEPCGVLTVCCRCPLRQPPHC